MAANDKLRISPWLPAALLSLAVYWPGLTAWFQSDDFAWLSLGGTVTGLPSLLHALFAPMAQGTVRPLSERAFFMGFHRLFGLEAFPYHAWVLLTQLATLPLLSVVARGLTGSKAAAWLAPLFWSTNSGLGRPMAWAAAYNQVLCSFLLALAVWGLMRWQQTGRRRYLVLEWTAFVAGLGALETMALYPALSLVYAWVVRSRPALRAAVPKLALSAVYVAVRLWALPAGIGPYGMHYDAGILGTLWHYWAASLGPARLPAFVSGVPRWFPILGTAAFTAVLLAAVRDRRMLFGPAWMLLALTPLLPLRDHRMDYYLTMPAAGLAIWGAAASALALRSGRFWSGVAAAGAIAYAGIGALEAHRGAAWTAGRSRDARTVVLGAAAARRKHPEAAIVLTGLTEAQYRTSVYHEPFRLAGASNIFIAPDVAARVRKMPGDKPLSRFLLEERPLLSALAKGAAQVYRFEPGRLVNITAVYFARGRLEWREVDSRRVDVGDPWFSRQLDKGWYNIDLGHRWMSGRASVRLGGPSGPAARLFVSGWCPAAQVRSRPLAIRFFADAIPIGNVMLGEPDSVFEAAFPLPASLHGKRSVIVSVEVERTFTAPPDVRNLGVVFGIFEIRD